MTWANQLLSLILCLLLLEEMGMQYLFFLSAPRTVGSPVSGDVFFPALQAGPKGEALPSSFPIALPFHLLILLFPLLQERHFRALARLTMPVAATNSETGKKGERMSVSISGSESNRQDGEQQSGTPTQLNTLLLPPATQPFAQAASLALQMHTHYCWRQWGLAGERVAPMSWALEDGLGAEATVAHPGDEKTHE